MPRVLHLISGLGPGGLEMWLLSMLREVPRSRWGMDFCCKGPSAGPLATVARDLGAQVFHCPLGLNHVSFARMLRRILSERQYHILHNHLQVYSGFPIWVTRRQRIPVITSFHNIRFAPQTRVTCLPIARQLRSLYAIISVNYALHHSDLVTGCSQGVLEGLDLDRREIPVPSRVLYYGVDVPQLATAEERASLRRSFDWPADSPLVLHVGRFLEQKNHLGLLAIFQRVLERVPTAKMLLVGAGLLRPAIEDTIARRGLSNTIRFLGLRDDVPSLMSKCDVFLFPSLHEGFGLVALEANAAGLPLVGSKIPGLEEAVKDGETALLHDVADTEGMAKSVVRIITDQQYAKRLGDAGRARVRESFSTEASAGRLLEIYDSFA